MLWQNVIVVFIVALAAGLTLWRFYRNFTGKSSCCGEGGCSGCGGTCGGGSGSGGLKGQTHLEDMRKDGGCCCH